MVDNVLGIITMPQQSLVLIPKIDKRRKMGYVWYPKRKYH